MRRLQDIRNELERAVFLASYHAPRQRLLRGAAVMALVAKHGLRGLLYIWPLLLVLFIELPAPWQWLRALLVPLAAGAWFRFVHAAVRDDYRRFVGGALLRPAMLRRLL